MPVEIKNRRTGKTKIYNTVKERKQAFKKDFPEYSVETEMLTSMEEAFKTGCVFIARLWKNHEDRINGKPPNSTGHSLSLKGGTQADATSWVENCEESAIGRALDNIGYSGDGGTCSAEEIAQAEHNDKALKGPVAKEPDYDDTTAITPQAQQKLTQAINGAFPEDEAAILSPHEKLSIGAARFAFKLAESKHQIDGDDAFRHPKEDRILTRAEAFQLLTALFEKEAA